MKKSKAKKTQKCGSRKWLRMRRKIKRNLVR
jgi:hypothetical protein